MTWRRPPGPVLVGYDVADRQLLVAAGAAVVLAVAGGVAVLDDRPRH